MAMYTEKESKGRIGREPNGQAEYFRFLLRMPQDMARKIDGWAKEDFSPMNSFILRMLRDQIWEIEAEQAQAEAEAEPEPGRRGVGGKAPGGLAWRGRPRAGVGAGASGRLLSGQEGQDDRRIKGDGVDEIPWQWPRSGGCPRVRRGTARSGFCPAAQRRLPGISPR